MAAKTLHQTLNTLYDPGDVIEIRIIEDHGKNQSGYYDYEHFDKLADDADKLDGLPGIPGIYITVNPVQPILLARSNNKIKKAKETTTDSQTQYRKYIPFDVDPVRPAGVSSTDELHDRSIEKAHEIKEWLKERGFPDPIIADSGNGAHLLYKIDEPNTPEVKELIEAAQKAVIAALNHPDQDDIDIQGFANASRIWKFYGTIAKKGEEIPELGIIHRRSKILEVPDDIQTATTEQLKTVAALYQTEPTKAQQDKPQQKKQTNNSGKFDIEGWMNTHDIKVVRTKKERGKTIYILETCPLNPDHTGNKEAVIIQEESGKLGFKCHHSSCADKHWSDVREKYEPGYREKRKSNRINVTGLTDWGNAKRLVEKYSEDIRYCPEMVGWYIWNGERWELDLVGKINQFAKSIAADLWDEAQAVNDLELKKRMASFAISTENQSKIKSLIESARNEPGIPVTINKFDLNRDILCVGNGLIDLRTSEMMGFDRYEYITKQVPTEYNTVAKCPRFERFLDEIFAGDNEVISFVKRYLGYSLTGHTNEQVFLLMEGSGANGKGTLIDTVMKVMGDYAMTTDPETIIQKKYERSSTNDLAALKGARFVTTSENEANQVLDEGRIKRITGQDPISCRFLYREFFEYVPEYNLALLTNHDIIIKAQDYSIWRRILKLHFVVKFDEKNRDKNLREDLIKENEGILKWLIDGAREWYDKGLMVPESVRTTTDEYKSELDIVGDFISLFCDVGKDKRVSTGDLYTMYKTWCGVTDVLPKGTRGFGRDLSDRDFTSDKINGIRFKNGLDLKEIHKKELAESKLYYDEKTIARALGSFVRQFLVSTIEESPRNSLQKNELHDPKPSPDSGQKNNKRPAMRIDPPQSHSETIIEKKRQTNMINNDDIPQKPIINNDSSQYDFGKRTMNLLNDWYGTQKPQYLSECKTSIIHELVRTTGMSHESALRHVTDAFKVRGWA